MYSMLPDDKIMVKLDLPPIYLQSIFKDNPMNFLPDICVSITKCLAGNSPILEIFDDVLLDTISTRLVNESSWFSESDSYDRIEAEKTLIAMNFIAANRVQLQSFAQRIENVYHILKMGLAETGREISKIEYVNPTPNELIMEILYERRFTNESYTKSFNPNDPSESTFPVRWRDYN